MTRDVEIRVLGPLEVARDGQSVPLPPSKKTRALLAYLTLTRRAHSRDRLCAMLWDVADDPRGALRWSLSKLRALVDGDEPRLIAGRADVKLELRDAEVDWLAVEGVARRVEDAETDALEQAAAKFRGELLEGLDLDDFDEFQAWCLAQREEARRARSRILRELSKRLASAPERALAPARALVQIDPHDEHARASLVNILVETGRSSEARQQVAAAKRLIAESGGRMSAVLEQAAASLRASPGRAAPDVEPATSAPEITPPPVAMPARVMRSSVHGLRLVGREREVARIGELLDECVASGRARALLLTGEPGIGKSRLLVEGMIEARRRHGAVMDCYAYEAERGRPYGPLLDALRRLPSPPTWVAGGSVGASSSSGPTLPEERELLFASVLDLVRGRMRDGGPLLLSVDDVQWLDEASAALLHYILRSARETPMLLLLTAQQTEIADNPALLRILRGLRRERMLEELVIERLGPADTARLARLVGSRVDGAAIHTESGGNPLFTLELARLGREFDPEASLGNIVRDRVERLPEEAIKVLKWASMLGPTFRVRVLKEVAGSTTDLLSALDELERHALLGGVVDLQEPGGTYQFAHDLVRRVVYGDISAPRRRLMHLEIARALELMREHEDSLAAEVAHHAVQAGEPELAAEACIAASRRCLKLFAENQALTMAHRGLRHAELLTEPRRRELVTQLEQLIVQAETALEVKQSSRAFPSVNPPSPDQPSS
jgi:DNA-binding SARP family transcriptional activator